MSPCLLAREAALDHIGRAKPSNVELGEAN